MVNKAVILAGGRGTRFLPYTKACPKEMFALSDKPVLHYIVDEVVRAGIKDILIIISPEKELIKKYFSHDERLNNFLISNKKDVELEKVLAVENMANITFAVQTIAKGSGDALLMAEKFANGEALAVLNADDVMRTAKDLPVVLKQIVDCYSRHNTSVLAVQEVPPEIVVKCGAISIVEQNGRDIKIDKVVEKPKLEDAPSHYVTLGRYVVSPDYFSVLKRTPLAKNGELNLTDALNIMAIENGLYAYLFEGKRYDMGNKLGCFEAMVDFALSDEETGDGAMEILKSVLNEV
ncbi:MAG: UTP--glucose-1-phosphate uridylyltransferase [Clostridia bacterium]